MESIEWPTIALVAAIGLILELIGLKGTGIMESLTNIFTPIAKAVPWYILLSISLLWAGLQCNVTASTATTTLVYSVMVPAAVLCGSCYPVALGVAISVASNFSFILPSTSHNAVAVGSGWVPPEFMIRYGSIVLIPAVLFLSLVGYPLARLIFR